MSRETIAKKIQVISTGDCLTGTVCTIANYLAPSYHLRPGKTQDVLKNNSDRYLTNLFDLLDQNGLGVIHHDLLRVKNDGDQIFQVLETALLEGSLCELTVQARPWVKKILGINTKLPEVNLTHSIVIYGYYWPHPNDAWFYVIDPYISDHVFVNWWQLLEVLYPDRNRININTFGLSPSSNQKLTDLSIKMRHVNGETKREMLSELAGKNTKEKLKFLFHPKK